MEKFFVVNFYVESEAYVAFEKIQDTIKEKNYKVHCMSLIQKLNGKVAPCEGYEAKCYSEHGTTLGGVIGTFIGVLGGPVGMILGGAAGSAIGNKIKNNVSKKVEIYLETIGRTMQENDIALIAFVKEEQADEFEEEFSNFNAYVQQKDAALVAEEVEDEMAFQYRMESFNKKTESDKKAASLKEKIENKRTQLKNDFKAVRENLKVMHDEFDAYTNIGNDKI